MRRFKYKYDKQFQYIAVIERGTLGTKRLYLHIICFDLPYINVRELQKVWKYGRIDQKVVKNMEVVSYMTKYIEKKFDEENNSAKDRRLYFSSKNLKKSLEVLMNDEEINEYLSEIKGNPYFQFNFSNEYVGEADYCKFLDMDPLAEYTDC